MRAGTLRHRVILERPTEQQEEGGQVIDAYAPVTIRPIPAQVEDIAGREFFAAAQVQADVTTRIRIRFRDDVDEKWRVRHITRYASPMIEHLYDVVAAIPDMKTGRKELQLMCTRRVAEGWRKGEENTSSPATEYRVDDPNNRVDDDDWRVDSIKL